VTNERPAESVGNASRFMAKVVDGSNGCRLWIGGVSGRYGAFRLEGKSELAHRAAWRIFNGPIPEGMTVCHVCDVCLCVNVDHLFLGTQADNMRDKADKGRGGVRLSVAGAQAVRSLRADGVSIAETARRMGVSQTTVKHVQARRTWANV